MLLLRFDVLEVVGGWPEAAVRSIPEDAGFEGVFDEALNIALVNEQSWNWVVAGFKLPAEGSRVHIRRPARSTDEANCGSDKADVDDAILYKKICAILADLRSKEKLDPGSSGESLQQPNCVSEREWLFHLQFGRCMLFQ